MSSFLKPVLDDLLRVPISQMDKDWIKTHRKKLFLGWGDKDPKTSEYLSRKPTLKEMAMFVVELERLPLLKEAANVGVEAAAMQTNQKLEWTGTILNVGKEAVQFAPIPHQVQADLTPYDAPVAVVASMLLVEKDSEIDASLSSSVIEDGPLESLMTGQSYVEYVAQMSRLLEAKKVSGKGELFMRSVHEALHQATKDEKSVARYYTNQLFAPAKLQYSVATKSVLSHKNFTYEHKGVTAVKKEDGTTLFVPASIPRKMVGTIKIVPKKQVTEKNPANVMISHISSRFPPMQVKAWGYRGLPSKNQRQFMEHRPFLDTGAVMVDPDVTMSKWMEANGYAGQIRFGGGTIVKGTYDASKDVVLEHHDYKEPRITLGAAIFYGTIKFSPEFWRNYKVLSYRLDPKGKLYYVDQKYDTSGMSKDYCGWPLRVMKTELELILAYKELAAEMVQHLFIGSYGVKGRQYAHLKYPIVEKLYDVVDMSDVTLEETLTTWTARPADTGMVETSVSLIDDEDPNSSRGVVKREVPTLGKGLQPMKRQDPGWWTQPMNMSALEVKNDPNLISVPSMFHPYICIVETGIIDYVAHEDVELLGMRLAHGRDSNGNTILALPIVHSTDGHDRLYFLSPRGIDLFEEEIAKADTVSIPVPVLDA